MEILPYDQKEYQKLLKQLKAEVKPTIGDEHLLYMYIDLMMLYQNKKKIVFEGGDTQTFNTGVSQVSPDYTIMRDCLNQISKLSTMLGLNTAARARLKIEEPKESKDPLSDFE